MDDRDFVRVVFEISREIFKGNFDKINDKYKDREMESELISVIGKITDSVDLMNEGNEKEVKNMCTALEKLKEDSRNEGRKEGHENGFKAGRKEGREEERKALMALMKCLLDAGRNEDLMKITDDDEYREEVMKEFNLI